MTTEKKKLVATAIIAIAWVAFFLFTGFLALVSNVITTEHQAFSGLALDVALLRNVPFVLLAAAVFAVLLTITMLKTAGTTRKLAFLFGVFFVFFATSQLALYLNNVAINGIKTIGLEIAKSVQNTHEQTNAWPEQLSETTQLDQNYFGAFTPTPKVSLYIPEETKDSVLMIHPFNIHYTLQDNAPFLGIYIKRNAKYVLDWNTQQWRELPSTEQVSN